MLKSTHIPVLRPDGNQPPLPLGWSEHVAPTGHPYYYNTETKQSTYIRPQAAPPQHLPNQNLHLFSQNSNDKIAHFGIQQRPASTTISHRHGTFEGRERYQEYQNRRHREDRPKSKHVIPDCAPWVLVKTSLGRRFVHNVQTKESFWKFPKDVIGKVVEYEIQERKKWERRERGEPSEDEEAIEAHKTSKEREDDGTTAESEAREGGDEYEEVEVTDEEDEDSNNAKRQKTEEDAAGAAELGEEDMAAQLAAMGERYDLDPGEYGDRFEEEWEEGAEGIEMTEEEVQASFEDMLDDHVINPFTTWESALEEGRIVEDDRYTLLPNMKSRKDAFREWSTVRIQKIKDEKQKQAKQDPRIAYLAFLQQHATPKLYWPEFKRKFKKEPELKDTKLGDKEREKFYREHINRTTKISEETLKSDLSKLLHSIPASASWNLSTSLDAALPPKLLSDVRYISLPPTIRDAMIQEHITGLPPATELAPGEDTAEEKQKKDAREKREQALRERAKQVDGERWRQQRELAHGRERLREQEERLQRAMNVGKKGLRAQLGDTMDK